MKEFDRLVEIMKKLRAPDGCAWDKKQTIDSIKPYVLEEAYEVIEAVSNKNNAEICEELGDLLTQIVFISQIAEEQNLFDIKEVCEGISNKLVRRHPHVFGDIKTQDTKEILQNWEKIKSVEKGAKRKSVLDDIPKSLPSVIRAFKVQKRMSRVGFDWDDHEGAIDKIYEELDELKKGVEKKDHDEIEEEFGDLVFSIINTARFFNVDIESALLQTTSKVEKRFRYLEKRINQDGKNLSNMNLEAMDEYWEEAKKVLEKNEKI